MFTKNQGDDSWISVSDMMSGLMMIFLLIAIIYINNFAEQANQIERTQERICSNIVDEFIAEQKEWNMSVCEDGLLVSFDSDSVFDKGEASLKSEFKLILLKFLPRFMGIIIKNQKDIQELRIEGHTSSEYDAPSKEKRYVKNTHLSQRRSYSVMEFVFEAIDDPSRLNWLTTNLTAHGMSSSRLKLKESGKEDKQRSRRVEFRIQTNIQDKLIEEFTSKNVMP